MTAEEESTTHVVEETEQIEQAVPAEKEEKFQNAVDTETSEEEVQGTESSEPTDKTEMEAGANDAAPAAASASTATVANQPADEDRRADVEKQPYEFDKCRVQIAVQLLPEDGDAKGRPVLLGVRTHLDAPIIRVVRLYPGS